MENKHITKLPADDAVQNWFEENIDKECSASSAVYKFRLWLESLQTGHPRIGWVKASEFKYEVGVAYSAKDNESRGAGTFDEYGDFYWGDHSITLKHNQDDLLILDESGTAAEITPTFWDVAKAFKWAAEYRDEIGGQLTLYNDQWTLISEDEDGNENETQDLTPGNAAELYCLQKGFNKGSAGISQDAHEKEIMMQAFDKVRQIFEGRQWVLDGRGCYPYNDDRYKEEVRYMYNEFDEVVKDTWANIQSKSVDYRKAIIAEYLATPAAGREDAVEFAEWCATIAFFDDEYRLWELLREGEFINGQFRFTTKELYELFKQKEK